MKNFPDILINFGGRNIKWEPKHYLMWDEYEQSCMVLIQEEFESVWFWLLGDSFLRAFFSVYDLENKQVALVGDLDYSKWLQGETRTPTENG
jgi:hypothetical protein